jgi:arylsulfatase
MKEKITFDGRSLAKLLLDQESEFLEDRILVTQMAQSVPGGYHVNPPKWGNSVVLSQKWRLVNKHELYDIQKDPGQKRDIGQENHEIVKELQEQYEKYWTNILPHTERIARISIGNKAQSTTTLALAGLTPPQGKRAEWSQDGVAKARPINGKWYLRVEKAGTYQFELRRWPRELNKPINAFKGLGSGAPIAKFLKDAVQIDPVEVRVQVGEHDITKDIDPSQVSVVFNLKLKEGPVDLSTWFIDADGTSRSAYWVYVQKIKQIP